MSCCYDFLTWYIYDLKNLEIRKIKKSVGSANEISE